MAIKHKNHRDDTPIADKLQAGLYLVATPIGNLGDITGRAISTLKHADRIACEDTRMTAKLLAAYGIKTPLMSYHEHNSETQQPKILEALAQGQAVALVSDAGTPLISDPGYKLVRAVQESGYKVTACPGACAAIMGLSLSGLPTDRFTFAGFPPHKSKARQDFFASVKNYSATLIFYESARRLTDSLQDAHAVFGDRHAAVCRELTKKFEETRQGSLSELLEYYTDHGNPKGEVVLLVDRAAHQPDDAGIKLSAASLLQQALDYMSVKDASAFVASVTGEKKKSLYQQALLLKDQDE